MSYAQIRTGKPRQPRQRLLWSVMQIKIAGILSRSLPPPRKGKGRKWIATNDN